MSTPLPYPFIDGDTRFGDVPMLVAGRWTPALGAGWIDVSNPACPGDRIARVPAATSDDVDLAVAGAVQAQRAWGRQHFTERARALHAIADEIADHAEFLARLTALDTGNALRPQARPEVQTLISLFRYFAGVAGEFKGVVLPAGAAQLQYSIQQPLGVVGAILPWNSPLLIAGMKLPAALAAGNAVVVKAAELAPLPVLYLADLASRHLPTGLLSMLTGDGPSCGAAIARHPAISKVSFTGSTAVGRGVGAVATGRLAPVSLELGGKSPSVVWPDAAHTDTVDGVLAAMRITRQGQSCTAGSRLLVHAAVYDDFLEQLAARMRDLRVGDPLDEETDMGALINATQYDKVCSYVDQGRGLRDGETLVDGLKGVDLPSSGGYFMGPTLFGNADNTWRLAREEIFGPVLVAIPWREDEQVIRMANDSHYGLAAYLWCHDLDRALNAAHRIDAGWIQVNQGTGQMVGQSYGGFKDSGIGREFSLEGAVEAFTQAKQVNVRLAAQVVPA